MKVLLAYEKEVNGREIELVVKGERGQTVVCRVHSSIKLWDQNMSVKSFRWGRRGHLP